MKNQTSKLFIILAISLIACNQQKTDNAQSLTTVKTDTTKYKAPKVVKVNKDSLPVFTPGENGVPLPEVIKLGEPEIMPLRNSPIIPGVSYLPQSEEEINTGKPPVLSKRPKVIKKDFDSAEVYTLGENGLKPPEKFIIYDENSKELIENKYTIQHGDTIYPPKSKLLPQPVRYKASMPDFKDRRTKNIYNLSVDEGVSYGMVMGLLQDKNGNIWMATNATGLCKYDGTYFYHYTGESGYEYAWVRKLFEDSKGNIWFDSDGHGVVCYNGHSFTQYTNKQGLSGNNVRTIEEDANGNLWFGTSNGLSCYDGNSFLNYTSEQGLSSDNIYSILVDKQNKLWIGTAGGGLILLEGDKFKILTKEELGLSHNDIASIYEDTSNPQVKKTPLA